MTSKRSFLFWAGLSLAAILGLILIACGGAYWWYDAHLHPAKPRFAFATPKDEAEGRLQDVDALRHLVDFDRSFTPETKAAFLERLDSIRAGASEMSLMRFELEISEAVALADGTHTYVHHEGRLNRLPLRMAQFREGLIVTKATAENADLLGARVLA